MPDLSEIVSELIEAGITPNRANFLAARLIAMGADASPYRKETSTIMEEVRRRRQMVRGH